MRRHFYPRSPCGERLIAFAAWLAECLFLSTLSLRRATRCQRCVQTARNISIHALLAESDASYRQGRQKAPYFYPRSPCGERRCRTQGQADGQNFYPRSPCGERQDGMHGSGILQEFLSTLSLRRATFFVVVVLRPNTYFYPRSPCGERQGKYRFVVLQSVQFLSTLSLRRATPRKHGRAA